MTRKLKESSRKTKKLEMKKKQPSASATAMPSRRKTRAETAWKNRRTPAPDTTRAERIFNSDENENPTFGKDNQGAEEEGNQPGIEVVSIENADGTPGELTFSEEDQSMEDGNWTQPEIEGIILSDEEMVITERGGIKILLRGYAYTKKKNMANGVEKYECVERQKHKCYGAIKVRDKIVEAELKDHNHAPNAAKNHSMKIRSKIRNKAMVTVEKPHQIMQGISKELGIEVAGILPIIDHHKRRIRGIRQKLTGDEEDITRILEAKKLLPNGEDFVLYNSYEHTEKGEQNHVIILGTTENIEYLKNSEHWFCDGTFGISPESFYQVYTIHCMLNGRVYPCIYALLSNKRQSLYQELFQLLGEFMGRGNSPTTITMDFELAAINAARSVFPDALLHGCYFHFRQSLYRKIQTLGLQQKYASDLEFSHNMKKYASLAFVPPDDVQEAFASLKSSMQVEVDEKLGNYSSYVEKTYIGTQTKKPMFNKEFWNVQHAVTNGLPKTNNHVEGF